VNVKQLRQTAKAQYAQGKGRRDLKGYSRMGKAALLSKLGMHEEARAHKSQATRRKAIAFNATKEGGDSSVKKAQIKGRILRSVKRGITAEEKKQGRKLTQEEKRTVAARALASEVKAIRSGTPESKPKRGGNHLEAQISNTKASIADVQANIRKAKEISASTGQPFDRYHKAMKGELEQHKASLSKLEKQHLSAINQGLKHGHSVQPIEGGYAMFQGSDRIGNLTAKTPQQVLAKSQKFEQETEGYQSQKGSGQSSTNIPEAERRHALNTSRDIFARTEIKNLDDWEKEAKSRKSPLSKDMKQASLKKAQQALTEKQAIWQRVNDAPEQKAAQKRTNDFLYKSSFSHTPPPGVSVAEHRANLRRQYGATSGTRNENLSKKEERRSAIGRGDEGESRIRKSEVADRVTEPKGEQGKAAISKELQRMVAERESGKQQGMISANDHQTLFQFKNMGDLDSQATDKVKQTAARVLGVHHSEIKELTRTSVGLNVRLRNESKPSFISESATRPRQIEVRDEKAIKKEAKRLLDEAKTVARERIAARESANLPTPKPNPQYKYEEYTPHEQQLAKIHTRAELEKMHGKLLGAQPGNSASHLRAIEKSTSMQSNSQARAQSGNVVRGNYEQRQSYNHALEIHDHYPEKSKQPDRVTEPEKAKKPSATLLEMAKNLHNLDSKDTHTLRQMAATHLGLDVSDIKEMGGSDRGLTVTRRSGQKTLISADRSTASKPESKAPDRVTEPEKAKNRTQWDSYEGKQPWEAERNKYGQSISAIAKPLEGRVSSVIEKHPDFADLKQKVDRSLVSTFGKGKVPPQHQTAESYITHTEYNSKSKRSQEIEALQAKILRESEIPSRRSQTARGATLDWHKMAVQSALKEGQPVPDRVLESFGLSQTAQPKPESSPTVTRGTKAKPWSGNDAPTSTRSGRGEMVRGRSID